MNFVADYSIARPGGATLKAAGASGVMRYTGDFRSDGAIITKPEWADLTAHGLAVGLVMEYAENWIMGGYATGHSLALAARALEDKMGIPRGVTYAACDFEISPGQYAQALDTMHGMADAYGGWQFVRPYGSKAFCEWVQANSPIRGSWSTFAWSWDSAAQRFMPAGDARIWQYNYWPSSFPVVGGCDFNEVLGDWAPRNVTLPPLPSTDWSDMTAGTREDFKAAVREVLNEGSGKGQKAWARTNGALYAMVQEMYADWKKAKAAKGAK